MNIKELFSVLYVIGQILELVGAGFLYKSGAFRVSGFSGNTINERAAGMAYDIKVNEPYEKKGKYGFFMVVSGVMLQLPIAFYNCL